MIETNIGKFSKADTAILKGTALLLLFFAAPKGALVNRALTLLGRRATSMWFCHTWFCLYLFRDFIYSFRYPLLIFAVLLIVSSMAGYIIDRIYDFVIQAFNLSDRKRQIKTQV